MAHARRSRVTTCSAPAGAGLIAVAAVLPSATAPDVQHRAVWLAGADSAASPLGDGIAFAMGGSTIPVPPQRYADAVDAAYLEPRGFTGAVEPLFTPEGLYPITGVKSLPFDTSVNQGQQTLVSTVQQQISAGNVDGDNPAVVFGWSQSATLSGAAMTNLADRGVPSADVHFVLVGDPNNPNGGMLSRFDVPVGGHSPTAPALGITFGDATPNDLYPTEVYTNEYDGFADFPRYPIDVLSDLNALLGILFQHTAYLGLTPEQLTPVQDGGTAILLPGSESLTGEGLTDYYLIPDDQLPLLQVLQFVPYIGQPLYDLLEPDMRILVNLGYGSVTDGWAAGDADELTTFGLFPTELDWGEVGAALVDGAKRGIDDAVQQLQNPDNYDLSSILDNPALVTLIGAAHNIGLTDATDVSQLLNLPSLLELARSAFNDNVGFPAPDVSIFSSSPTEIIDALTGTVAADYAALLPIADTVDTLLTTVPSLLVGFASEQLSDGDILDAIGMPIAAAVGLVPIALTFGVVAPLAIAAGGTLVNFADLLGLGAEPVS